MKKRCQWVGQNKNMINYHDKEWGLPCYNDKILFEYFILETFQVGLSWAIVLNKRKNFKKAFSNYNIQKVAKYDEEDFERLINDKSIIRNKLKIRAAIINAQKFLDLKKEFGSFSNYLWKFTNWKVIKNKFKKISDLPNRTKLSDKISEDLKKRGFKFVGSTVIYAFMQGIGMINDHTINCFRYREVQIS